MTSASKALPQATRRANNRSEYDYFSLPTRNRLWGSEEVRVWHTNSAIFAQFVLVGMGKVMRQLVLTVVHSPWIFGGDLRHC
ncbi:hypothetical protein [Tolypothrix sp. VBCCA 56010]|uniref:hypothetical protein n=1 Tax=Tolypothrix sp. VBCCA 56010 TaxID=3137731 RepID=UPI003D7E716A